MALDKAERGAWAITITGGCANLFLIMIKFGAGFFGHSQALIADAIHSISDLFTDAVVMFGLWRGRKPPDESHHFGHGRIETLATATVGLTLIGAAFYLGLRSAAGLYSGNIYHPTALALVGAGISIAFKEGLYHFTVRVGRRIKSELVVANAWHHRSDAFSSVAVFIGVAVARINPRLHYFDALAALLVSLFILKVGYEIFKKALAELSDTAPSAEIQDRINRCACSVKQVLDTHDLRVRTIQGRYQIEIHIVVDGQQTVAQGHAVAKAVEHCLICDFMEIDKVIVHVDPAET